MSGVSADIKHRYLFGTTIAPQSVSAGTLNGSAVDCDRCGAGKAGLQINTLTGTLDVKLQESDASGSGFVDIAGAAFAQQTAGPNNLQLNFKRSKRYVRGVAVVGTGPVLMALELMMHRQEV